MKKLLPFDIVALAALLALFGCNDKDTLWRGGDPWIVSVQIVMPTDTLHFLPGDSACVQGFVVVKDDAGRVMQGVKVNLELTLLNVGSIEFLGAQDMTDAIGRVYILYRTYGQVGPGYNIIHAWVGSAEDRWTLWLRVATGTVIDSIRVTASPDTIYWPQDSVLVTVCVLDSAHAGIPDITIPLEATGGRMIAMPLTDSTGCTHGIFYSNDRNSFCISVRMRAVMDSACVVVIDTTRRTPPLYSPLILRGETQIFPPLKKGE